MRHLVYLEQCLSTNDEILRNLPEILPDFFGLYTFNQTKGRGQYGNTWENAMNKNMAFSLAAKCSLFPSDNLINFCTATLLRRFIVKLTSAEAKIKWPNDLILNGKKISGILIEKKKIENVSFYIIGIGLNILQENYEHLPKAGSLLTQTGQHFDPKSIAEELFYFLTSSFQDLESVEDYVSEFNDYLFRKNQISVFEKKGIRQNGIIQKMDSGGYLWIELENEGLQKFFHKEIELFY